MTLEADREHVAQACRKLAEAGLVIGSAGNVSKRCGDLVAVTASGASFAGMTADQVTVVRLSGEVVAGRGAPTSEMKLHLGVYQQHGSAAVVHTHPPYGTALACVLDELPVVHYALLALGGPIRVAPYATFGSAQLAGYVVKAMAQRQGALMANHGAVTHDPAGLDRAVELSVILEWVCAVYWRAASIGTPRVLDDAAQAAARAAWAGYPASS